MNKHFFYLKSSFSALFFLVAFLFLVSLAKPEQFFAANLNLFAVSVVLYLFNIFAMCFFEFHIIKNQLKISFLKYLKLYFATFFADINARFGSQYLKQKTLNLPSSFKFPSPRKIILFKFFKVLSKIAELLKLNFLNNYLQGFSPIPQPSKLNHHLLLFLSLFFEFLSICSLFFSIPISISIPYAVLFFAILKLCESLNFAPRNIGLVEGFSFIFLSAFIPINSILLFVLLLVVVRIIIPISLSILWFFYYKKQLKILR